MGENVGEIWYDPLLLWENHSKRVYCSNGEGLLKEFSKEFYFQPSQ